LNTLPLDTGALSDYFNDTSLVVDVDYNSSRDNLGSPLAVLTYVANIGMTCVLHGDIDNELIVHYMTMRTLTTILNLQIVHANILYTAKYGTALYPNSSFCHQQTVEFIKNNKELVQYQTAFMNSTQLYFYNQLDPSIKERSMVTNENFPQLGFSLLRLFGVIDFMTSYLVNNPPLESQIYFERYFDDLMFAGAPMYSYFHVPENMFAGLGLVVSELNVSSLKQLETELSTIRAVSDEELRQLAP
jgi:hypothetical protein